MDSKRLDKSCIFAHRMSLTLSIYTHLFHNGSILVSIHNFCLNISWRNVTPIPVLRQENLFFHSVLTYRQPLLHSTYTLKCFTKISLRFYQNIAKLHWFPVLYLYAQRTDLYRRYAQGTSEHKYILLCCMLIISHI